MRRRSTANSNKKEGNEMTLKHKAGDIVTVVDTEREHAIVMKVVKQGRRYLHVVAPGKEPDKYNVWQIDLDVSCNVVLAGARYDIQERLLQLCDDRSRAIEAYEKRFRNDRWDWERQWHSDNPFPGNPVPGYLREIIPQSTS